MLLHILTSPATCFSGMNFLLLYGAFKSLPWDYAEAVFIDGGNDYTAFFKMYLPMILPTVSTFVVANVATLFTNQANLYAFFGEKVDYANQTLGYYLFVLVNKTGNGKTMYTYASALGIVCTLIAFPLTMLARKLLNSVGDE